MRYQYAYAPVRRVKSGEYIDTSSVAYSVKEARCWLLGKFSSNGKKPKDDPSCWEFWLRRGWRIRRVGFHMVDTRKLP